MFDPAALDAWLLLNFSNPMARLLIPVVSSLDAAALGVLQAEASRSLAAATVEFRRIHLDCANDSPLGTILLSDEDKQLLENAEVVIGDPPFVGNNLPLLKNAKWVHSFYAGVDSIVSAADSSQPPRFTLTRHVGTSFGQQMGEYVLAQIVARERNLFSIEADMQHRKWQWKTEAPRTLPSLSIGILGVGHIGKRIAEMCKSMGMKVWGLTRTSTTENLSCIDHSCQLPELSKLLESCDYVCNMLPDTPQTKGVLNGDTLKHCASKKSVFINIGRGSIVSEAALIHAIDEGWLGGAILDVYENEPLPLDSPLWNVPSITLTPHMSGCGSISDFVSVFLDNLHRYLNKQPLKYTVDLSRGY